VIAKQSRVNHYAMVTVFQKKTATHDAPNCMEPWRIISHGYFITGITPNLTFKN
jgi:hypothetical protein